MRFLPDLRYVLAATMFGVAAGASCSGVVPGDTGDGPTDTGGSAQPIFGPTKVQDTAPPPISGGTLLVTADGTAVAADPDRDEVHLVDLSTREVTTIPLQAGDEPGRVADDGNGRAFVALRSGGAVVTIDLASKSMVERREVCVAPRGLAFDPSASALFVACASGELVELPSAGGPPIRTLHLDRDLRDVVIHPDTILVTHFRSAAITAISKDTWEELDSFVPPNGNDGRTPSVAWRALPDAAAGGMFLLHQRGAGDADPPVATTQGGYADAPTPPNTLHCGRAIVETAISFFSNDDGSGSATTPALSSAVVPVDLARSSDGRLAVAAAGNAFTPGAQSVLVFDMTGAFQPSTCVFPKITPQPPGQPVAVAFDESGADPRLVVQTREPAALFLPGPDEVITLSAVSRDDTGHDVFHANSGGDIACASCHPEGGDDGRVWTFDDEGPRRTPSLRGTVADTAPYHWAGEMKDFSELAHDVFSERMSGPTLAPDQTGALSYWVNRVPAPKAPPPADPAAAARGQSLFEGAAGCADCHSGPKLTNDETVDVGTGAPFQVPSLLGVGYRAPFLHDGCASSLRDRLLDPSCAGAAHGHLGALTDDDLSDLSAYLDTL